MQPASRSHLPSLAQLIFSGIGFFLAGVSGGVLLILGLWKAVGSGWADAQGVALYGLGWVALALAALGLLSALTAAWRLQKREPTAALPGYLRPASRMMLVWLAALLVSALAGRSTLLTVFQPLLKIAVVILPVWWLVELGRAGLSGGSMQRLAGVLGVSVLFTPLVVMVLDALLAGGVVLAGLAWVGMRPDLTRDLQNLAQQIAVYSSDPQALMDRIMPYVQTTGFRFAALGMLSGLVPLVEELTKPLALWLLAGKRLTPAEGFTAGLIAGGGFALVETLGLVIGLPDGLWWMTALQRSGTALLHILCVGLTGWGLASAWSEGRYLRLAVAFAAAVGLHGLWNALSISTPLFVNSAALQMIGLVGQSAGMLAVLLIFNRRLRREQAAAQMPRVPVVESTPENSLEN